MANLVQSAIYVIATLLVSWQLGALSLIVSGLISYASSPLSA